MKNIITLFFLYLIVIFILVSCKTQSQELKAILETPVSTTQLATGDEVSRSYQDKGVTLGKPVPAEVRIIYKPKGKYTNANIYDELIGILDKDGWKREDLDIDQPGFFRAALPQAGFTIRATVTIQSDRNTVSLRLRSFPQ